MVSWNPRSSSSVLLWLFRFRLFSISMIHQFPLCVDTQFLVTFDIYSLFTSVPLDGTISICADYLYRNRLEYPPENIFIELMELATKSLSLSYCNIICWSVDGISMGSPLDPLMTNVYVGFLEQELFDKVPKPYCYVRFVDDTFSCFSSHNEGLKS